MDNTNHRRHEHHLRKRVPQQQDAAGGTMTVVEVVFVTTAPTFDGDTAGFVTPSMDVEEAQQTKAPSTRSPAPSQSVKKQTLEGDESSQTTFRKTTRTSVSSDLSTRTSSFSDFSTGQSSTFRSSATIGSDSTSSTNSAQTGQPTNSAGLTIGTYAGIVGGSVFAILLFIVGIAIMIKRKKKRANYTKPEDEKDLNRLSFNDRAPPSPVPMPTALTPAAAPKLQIRPMTQFDGSFFPSASDTMKSEDRPVRAPPPALSVGTLGAGPFETPEPSPAMSAFSDSSNMNLPIQGGTGTGPSTVHRILVDFKPSMSDELELKAGEIVRLLHEYDDGWALCVRMDRTQQGVCPRTCLSPRPVKPRPPQSPRSAPPPPQNGARSPGGPPRPQSPGGRPQSPGMGPGSRPQSPRSPGPNRPPMSPKGMPGPPRRPDSRPGSPMGNRQPHPLSKVQKDDDVQFHAM